MNCLVVCTIATQWTIDNLPSSIRLRVWEGNQRSTCLPCFAASMSHMLCPSLTLDGVDVSVHVDPPVGNRGQALHLRDEGDELLVFLLVPVGLPYVTPAPHERRAYTQETGTQEAGRGHSRAFRALSYLRGLSGLRAKKLRARIV